MIEIKSELDPSKKVVITELMPSTANINQRQ
jgi:hypothetical protein